MVGRGQGVMKVFYKRWVSSSGLMLGISVPMRTRGPTSCLLRKVNT